MGNVSSYQPDVIIVGAGLAGLRCASLLHHAGKRVQVLERAGRVGGRVATDEVDGFQLDHGFQILLTAYPEARKAFDYKALRLARFNPGARLRVNGRWTTVADPWRMPSQWLATLSSPVGSLSDKLRIAVLRRAACSDSLAALWNRPEISAYDYLRQMGFSETMISRFFRPFLGGVFLENKLTTSSRMLEFVMRMFAQGDACVPEGGMGQLPLQLARQLPPAALRLNAPAVLVEPGRVILESGECVHAPVVVLATEARAAARLAPGSDVIKPGAYREVACHYYAAPAAPMRGPWLLLNGEGKGPVNNVAVMSETAPGYAPRGQSLIAVSTLDVGTGQKQVRDHLRHWFGAPVDAWRFLRTYAIPHALPGWDVPSPEAIAPPVKLAKHFYLAGDHTASPSIQGALLSGRVTAEAILGG